MLKRFAKPVLCSLIAALTFLAASSSVSAQLSSPMSPWLGMMDRTRSPGGLDNYNRNVRPQQDALRAYAAQQSQNQAMARELQSLQGGGAAGGSGSGVGPRDFTGGGMPGASQDIVLAPPKEIPSTQRNPAGFYQYLHYYPPGALPRRPVPNFSQAGRR